MEATCNRCHQGVPAEGCFCPTCGLPQLVYASSDETTGTSPAERWTGAGTDAATVDWKAALRAAVVLAIPAGLLSSGQSPFWPLSVFWMSAAAAWAVTLYVRRQRQGWITVGAGARIGLVTGLMAGWLAFASSGATLYALRFLFRQGKELDEAYSTAVVAGSQWLQSFSPNPQATADLKARLAWSLSSYGRAGSALGGTLMAQAAFLLFAVAGGAISARLLARRRRQAGASE